jgi:hypothetical protein
MLCLLAVMQQRVLSLKQRSDVAIISYVTLERPCSTAAILHVLLLSIIKTLHECGSVQL